MSSTEKSYRLYGPPFKNDPHPVYAAMREEAPLYRRVGKKSGRSIWFVTRYDDAVTILRDHQRFVKDFRRTLSPEQLAEAPPEPRLVRLLSHHMLNLDAPDHTRLRALVSKAFTARMVNQMEDRVQAIAHKCIDKVESQGKMDLINAYAFPLPIVVIAELLGIPKRDHHRFRHWSAAFVSPFMSEKEIQKKTPMLELFIRYLHDLFEKRRTAPQDDLLTALIEAEEAGERLSEDELYSMIILLIVAGHETAANLIGNGMLALLQNPDQWQLLQQQPELALAATEEFIRLDGPVERATTRFATEDVLMDGQLIRRGDAVNVVLAATSRDPAQFTDPDKLDILREDNRHLGFGLGVHYCVGAPLARMEVPIALNVLAQRLPNLRLADPEQPLRWRTGPIIRGLKNLPVVW